MKVQGLTRIPLALYGNWKMPVKWKDLFIVPGQKVWFVYRLALTASGVAAVVCVFFVRHMHGVELTIDQRCKTQEILTCWSKKTAWKNSFLAAWTAFKQFSNPCQQLKWLVLSCQLKHSTNRSSKNIERLRQCFPTEVGVCHLILNFNTEFSHRSQTYPL